MKTRLPRQEFQDALAAVSTLTGGRTTKPILSCVKLTTDGDVVRLSATDGEASLRLGVPAYAVEQPGETVVPADRLLGIIREMADAEVLIQADDRHCTVRGQGSEFRIFVQTASEFPPIPEFEDEPDQVIEGDQLRRMIALTIYAAARETSRYAINGVLWEKQGKRLFLVATDGRRLARSGGPIRESASGDFQAIVPAKALSVFERVFVPLKAGDEWTVELKVMPTQILLRSGDRLMSTALVEGHFPKYQEVIPRDTDKRARMDRLEFYSAIRRAALLTTEDARAVKLAFGKDRLVVTGQSPEQGDARIEIPISYEGTPLEIGFNPVFVNDALKVIPYQNLCIDLQENFRPGVIYGEDKNDFLYVVMPVSL